MSPPYTDSSRFTPEQLAKAKALADDPNLRRLAYLVTRGIPYAIAEALLPDERLAFAKALARIEGSAFDWDTMKLTRLRGVPQQD